MGKTAVAVVFLVILLAGCGANSATESTQPEETTSDTTSESAQPEQSTAYTTTESTQPEEITSETTTVPEETTTPTVAPTGQMTAIGDSVMVGAVDALQQEVPNLAIIYAQGCLQAPAAIDILRQWRASGQIGDVVVVHVGNNGPFTAEMFDEMMRVLSGVGKVLVVNLTVPPGVEDPIAVPNNSVLADGVRRYPNTVLVDWHAASAGHPEFFGEDATHLSLQGARAYAELIANSAYPSQEQNLGGSGGQPPPVIQASGCPAAPTP